MYRVCRDNDIVAILRPDDAVIGIEEHFIVRNGKVYRVIVRIKPINLVVMHAVAAQERKRMGITVVPVVEMMNVTA